MSQRTAWATALAQAGCWDPPALPTVVVVPHPDDETLAMGGLIATQRGRDVPVSVIAVTDGEQAYPGQVEPDLLAAVRCDEQRAALRHLGVDGEDIHRLRLPDGDVASHEAAVVQAITDLAPPQALLAAPWREDVHPDHEACGRAAQTVAEREGLPLGWSLFWTYHRRMPSVLPPDQPRGLRLSQVTQRARALAMAEHRSQTQDELVATPLLCHDDLAPVRWPTEYYVLPGTDHAS